MRTKEDIRREIEKRSKMIERYTQILDRLEEELATTPDPPAEPPIGSVIAWHKSFGVLGGASKTYTYVALRAPDGKWYTTGNSRYAGTWTQLISDIGPDIGSIQKVEQWSKPGEL